VLALEPRHQFAGAGDARHGAYALAAAPDVLPGLLRRVAVAEAHLAGVALRQLVRVQPGVADAGLQVVAVHAGEQVRVDDLVRVAVHDGLLVSLARARLVGRDEGRA